ncbi:MAG: hypothetical protein M0R03_19845, partial [Novosphingobium sp.]|nr:hypothetical protein [Novosphingobium sp.]
MKFTWQIKSSDTFKDRLGKCYILTFKYITNEGNEGDKLVHGTITRKKNGYTIDHAWIETADGNVIDCVLDWTIPKDAYYGLYDAKKEAEYDIEEVYKKAVEYETYGPWHNPDSEIGKTSSELDNTRRALSDKKARLQSLIKERAVMEIRAGLEGWDEEMLAKHLKIKDEDIDECKKQIEILENHLITLHSKRESNLNLDWQIQFSNPEFEQILKDNGISYYIENERLII